MNMLKRLKRLILRRHRDSSQTTPSQDVNSPFWPQSTPWGAWENAWEGTKTILRLVRDSADVFPPLKSTAGGLIGLIDLIEVHPLSISLLILN